MNRIKNAWLVLVGRKQATDISQELLDQIESDALTYDMHEDDLVEQGLVHVKITMDYAEEMQAEMDADAEAVINAAEGVVRDA